jgi:hypothetical protein
MIDVFLERVKNLRENINDVFADVIEGNKENIITLNTSQLEKGLTAERNLIVPDYASEAYAKKKNKKSPGLTPDLKQTGNFYSEFDVVILPDGESAQITSFDEKTPHLDNKYANIFGLNKNSLNKIKPNLKKSLEIKIRDELKI